MYKVLEKMSYLVLYDESCCSLTSLNSRPKREYVNDNLNALAEHFRAETVKYTIPELLP